MNVALINPTVSQECGATPANPAAPVPNPPAAAGGGRTAKHWRETWGTVGFDQRSCYPPQHNPNDCRGWPRAIAHEPHLAGALALFAERFGYSLDVVCEEAWCADPRWWQSWDTHCRLEFIRSLLSDLIRADMDRSLDLVEVEPISTIGD